jgi:SAM-dependent methyltransferase
MFARSAVEILESLPKEASVLDVGAGASPFPRADWVLDLMPWDQRGLYGYEHRDGERFGPDTWVTHDICAREPFPFDDNQFDFVVCSHTLEDVRDPIWVCSELSRIAKAGYIETPSRLEEQAVGVQGPWVGWGHHRWLVEEEDGALVFTFKHHVLCGRSSGQFPYDFWSKLSPEERVLTFWWKDQVAASERLIFSGDDLDGYLEDFVRTEMAQRDYESHVASPRLARWARRLAVSLRR